MAALDTTVSVQVANVDLGAERQNLLRKQLGEYFAALAARARVKKRLVYTVNAEGDPLDKVLRMNEGADALFTGFLYDTSHSESFKQQLSVETPEEQLQVDPQLRYPRIAELLRVIEGGHFRHRKLILVGDIHEKLQQYLRSGLPVEVTAFTDPERTETSPPIRIVSPERLDPDPQAPFVEGQPIPVSAISTLTVAEIPFAGIVNMPEEGNRFVFRDATVIDTVRKLYAAEGLAAELLRERAAEEKRAFVRGKKVFIVLEADLEHVIAERFQFDRMQRLYRFHTVDEARQMLASGKGTGIVDYFEREGYQLVFEMLYPEQRDRILVAVLGDRLPAVLLKEIEAVRGLVSHLEPSDVESLFYQLPEPVVDAVLGDLQARNYEKFLAVVPPRIREAVILEFLGRPEHIQQAWRALGEPERAEILASQAAALHGTIFLLDTPFAKRKFPALQFEFERNFHSSMLAKMGAEQQQATWATIVRSMEAAGVPKGLLARQLSAEELERWVVAYVSRNAAAFYNKLNPGVRKRVWLTVGRTYREHITRSLHALDKIEILQGSKEAAVGLVFANEAFLAHLRSGEELELCGALLLMLKKLNKGESKTALLKQVLTAPDWRERRVQALTALLNDPRQIEIYDRLAEHVEELDFHFDSLVCTKGNHEALKEEEALRGAVVTLVDDLVDPSLYNLFQKGHLSREAYDTFSQSVEQEIAALRRKMAAREGEDPVGVYVLETMQILHQLTNESMAGGLNAETVDKLDARRAIRQRLTESLQEHARRIDAFVARAEQQLPLIEQKLAQFRKAAGGQEQALRKAHGQAAALAAEYRKLQQAEAKALENRKTVALTQKELSVQFFELIQPLILEKVRTLGNPLTSLLRMVGLKERDEGAGAESRVIFKFSDEEIANILRYKIVFCAKDTVLAQFVATCLRIDGLEDTLFTLATAETLPQKSDIDILFYGPGYSVDDFSDSVKKHRLVPFADEAFYRRLQENEQLKARTKTVLARAEKQRKVLQPRLAAATAALKAEQAKRRKVQEGIAGLEGEQHKLRANLRAQQERRLHLQGELELMESRLAEVDGQFDDVRSRLTQLVGGEGGRATELLQAGQAELAEKLRDELIGLNGELARMMFIKGVKDAGAHISQRTQDGLLTHIEQREVYPYAQRPFKKLLVAHDGSTRGENLKHAFLQAALPYFKLRESAVQEISVKRLLALAENGTGGYPFVALFCERPEDDYADLKLDVKRIRALQPEMYQLLFTPFGDLSAVEPASPFYRNLLALKDQCTLVNTELGNVGVPAGMLRVLRSKVPLG